MSTPRLLRRFPAPAQHSTLGKLDDARGLGQHVIGVTVPTWIVLHDTLSADAVRLYALLSLRADRGAPLPSASKLPAALAGRFDQLLEELRDVGALSLTRDAGTVVAVLLFTLEHPRPEPEPGQ